MVERAEEEFLKEEIHLRGTKKAQGGTRVEPSRHFWFWGESYLGSFYDYSVALETFKQTF